ncbi:hypothetical protein PC129_g24213, partial [Phytophthora cactorum]
NYNNSDDHGARHDSSDNYGSCHYCASHDIANTTDHDGSITRDNSSDDDSSEPHYDCTNTYDGSSSHCDDCTNTYDHSTSCNDGDNAQHDDGNDVFTSHNNRSAGRGVL